MKIKNLNYLFAVLLFAACTGKPTQPGSGTYWGVITNASVENVQSSTVIGWQTDRRATAICFYSNEAHDGTKSLIIKSDNYGTGRWFTKVNLKPWSEYRFTGWIKTEDLVSQNESGAGFAIRGFDIEPDVFKETMGWTKVQYEFSTGNNDSAIIECLFGLNGKSKGKAWFDNMHLELLSSEEFETSFSVDVTNTKEPMEAYIYGQFIEHLGRCIYGGIWAEMIEDRKFWYTVDDNESPWKLEGNTDQLSMDQISSFVGEHTPRLWINTKNPISLVQKGLGLKKDMSYSGHIILKGTNNIEKVRVSIVWGKDESDSESVEIAGIQNIFDTYPISFTSPVFTHEAKIIITVEGDGILWIGTVSLMPDDNVEGFRSDVLSLLKELNSPIYRWPGGNFVSGYDWMDGIGDRDTRPPRKNPAWTGIEHNDVGIHEFMNFCRLLDTEAYIAVNSGLGSVEEVSRQIEYVNGSSDTPMGELRRNNGRESPWNVKWWSIGNEMYGSWQLGFMSTEEYVVKHNAFADAMKGVDQSIKLVAVGELGDWDEMILSNCSDNMDYISEHFYRQDWHGGGLMTHIKQIPDAIREKAVAHRKYREEIPGLKDKDIRICMDEWNYWYGPHIYGELGTRYFLRDALGVAAGINEFSRNTDIIYMANYAQTVNVIGSIKTNTTHSVLAATGQALKMYRKYFGTIPVRVGNETRPFDVAATLTDSMDTLVVSVINPTWENRKFKMNVLGADIFGDVLVYKLLGSDDMAYNEPRSKMNVEIFGPEIINSTEVYDVEPFSATLFRYGLKLTSK